MRLHFKIIGEGVETRRIHSGPQVHGPCMHFKAGFPRIMLDIGQPFTQRAIQNLLETLAACLHGLAQELFDLRIDCDCSAHARIMMPEIFCCQDAFTHFIHHRTWRNVSIRTAFDAL